MGQGERPRGSDNNNWVPPPKFNLEPKVLFVGWAKCGLTFDKCSAFRMIVCPSILSYLTITATRCYLSSWNLEETYLVQRRLDECARISYFSPVSKWTCYGYFSQLRLNSLKFFIKFGRNVIGQRRRDVCDRIFYPRFGGRFLDFSELRTSSEGLMFTEL